MTIAEFSIKQRVFANMATLAVLVMGFVCAKQLRREIFPSISTDYLMVQTLDVTLNAPEDVERLVTVPIEDRVRNVEEVKEMNSVSAPNQSFIYLKLQDDVKDVQKVLNEVRQEVDQAKTDLPRTAETPVVQELKFPFPVITVGMTYAPGADRLAMKKIADDLEDRFLALPNIASVVIAGLSDRELWVEVDPYRAQSFGVSLDEIGAAVRAKNQNIPGGKLESESGEFTLRTLEQVDETTWRGIENVVIKRVAGQTVRVRDVATVRNTFEKDTTLGRVNGRPAITFTINKQKNGDTIKITDEVKTTVAAMRQRLPHGVELDLYNDSSKYVRKRLSTMIHNGIQSLLLVLALLLLFINWRIALMVTSGLVFAFLGSFIYLYFIDSSFNMISLFALILVLGMLVDDAIVVCENVYRYIEMGYTPHRAAIVGATEMLWPVVGTVTTTIVAFLPLLLTSGIIGKFIAIVPQVIAVALGLSLFEAVFILPAHLAEFAISESHLDEYFKDRVQHAHTGLSRLIFRLGKLDWGLRKKVETGLTRVTQHYRYLLRVALRHRYLVLAGAFLTFIAALALPATGVLRFQLFGADYVDRFMINLETPPYYRLEDTSDAVLALERDLMSNIPPYEIAAVIATVGIRQQDEFSNKYGNNQAQIVFDIDEENPRCRKPTPIQQDLRAVVRRHPAFMFARVEKEEGGPAVGKAVNVRIAGDDFDVLQKIAAEYETFLSTIPGVADISDDFERGKNEVHIDIDEGKAALAGCDVGTVGAAINNAFQGAEVSVFRWGNDEVTVRVKYADEYTRALDAIKNFRIVNSQGTQVPLGSIATITRAPGLASIFRRDRKRVISVFADVDDKRINSSEANKLIRSRFADLGDHYPGYTALYTGEEEETNESLRSMAIAGAIAFFLIFAILSGILNSFVQPVVILLAVPLSLIGVIFGFMLFQLPVGFMALMGTIGLAGIVVNDSIVMVSFINEYRAAWQRRHGIGVDVRANPNRFVNATARWSSLLRSGPLRLRPIFLCEATTVAGMSTIAFVRSGQEQFIAPMALAIVCGLTFTTVISLLITPCGYAILDDLFLFFFGLGLAPGEDKTQGGA